MRRSIAYIPTWSGFPYVALVIDAYISGSPSDGEYPARCMPTRPPAL